METREEYMARLQSEYDRMMDERKALLGQLASAGQQTAQVASVPEPAAAPLPVPAPPVTIPPLIVDIAEVCDERAAWRVEYARAERERKGWTERPFKTPGDP